MRRIATLAGALVLVAAACGGGGESTDAVEAADPSPDIADPSEPTDDTGDPTAPADDTRDSSRTQEADDTSSSGAIAVSGGWTVQHLGAGVKPVLALDADDQPAVAWLSEAIDEGFVSFASASEGWTEERIVEGYFYGPIGLDFDPDDVPHVVYHDHQADTFQDQLGDLAHAVRASLVFDNAGNPHLSYYANDGMVRYTTKTIDGWSIEDVGQLEAVEISFSGARRITAIDLDSNGSPHIVFGDLQVVRHATRAGDGWAVTDVLQAADSPLGQLVSLAIGSDDAVHIAAYTGSAAQPEAAEILYLTTS